MRSPRRFLLAVCAGILIAPLLVSGADATAAGGGHHGAHHGKHGKHHQHHGKHDMAHLRAARTAVAWQRIAVRTIWTETTPMPAPPVGSMYLAFTSLAVHDAAKAAHRKGTVAAVAAVATAAHDVLWEYFPQSRANLDADLTAVLDDLPDGWRADKGAAIGADAAADMIASRVDDGRFDASIVYQKDPAPGIWQPAPGGGMALAWLGFLDPVVDVKPVHMKGPDELSSAAYAEDYQEVLEIGSVDSTKRTEAQTATALFFAPPTISAAYRTAICDVLADQPMGLLPTTRLFARIDAAVLTSFIQTFRLKFDIGFWRPFQAIAGADTDGNPDTVPQAGWTPRIPNPAYSDYTSGHAAATSPFAEVVRRTLGDDTALVLTVGAQTRHYATLSELEHDALHARIWGGLHFRHAMDEGYRLGHVTAKRVMHEIR